MKEQIKFIYDLSYEAGEEIIPDVRPVRVEISHDAPLGEQSPTLTELLDSVDRFIRAAGYFPRNGTVLRYTEDDK